MRAFLHMSDLHFSTMDADTTFDHDKKIRAEILRDLGVDNRVNLDGIFITGDIAYHGKTAEFERAKEWFEEVRQKVKCPPEAVFVVPGNHDVDRSIVPTASNLWESQQALRKDGLKDADRNASLERKLKDSIDFLSAQEAYKEFAKNYACNTSAQAPAWMLVLNQKPLEDGSQIRVHGLNTAIVSNGNDAKANLLIGPTQFHNFSHEPGYVNIVLCHHPHSWWMDGNEGNDYLRSQSQIVLCGHEHDPRTYPEGGSLRVFAGAVHPNSREANYLPCYHILRLSMETSNSSRELVVEVETRVWMSKEKCFGPYAHKDGKLTVTHKLLMTKWERTSDGSGIGAPAVSGKAPSPSAAAKALDEFVAAKRKLVVHFFRISMIQRFQIANDLQILKPEDEDLQGHARWARVFDRAESNKKLHEFWERVSKIDPDLVGTTNPFKGDQ